MVLLEGDEFVRGILEPAGLTLADVRNRNLLSAKAPLLEQERPPTLDHQPTITFQYSAPRCAPRCTPPTPPPPPTFSTLSRPLPALL